MIVTVDGATFEVEVDDARPPVYRVRVDGTPETVRAVTDGATVHLFWRGRAYRIGPPPTARGVGRASEDALASPMPGRVIQVHVAAGEAVQKGQPLVVVEAMKMENVLRAPKEGTVHSVAVAVGDRVVQGQALLELR
jgi:3-methylcrotonyl-CoA carboxylase alpha subunit